LKYPCVCCAVCLARMCLLLSWETRTNHNFPNLAGSGHQSRLTTVREANVAVAPSWCGAAHDSAGDCSCFHCHHTATCTATAGASSTATVVGGASTVQYLFVQSLICKCAVVATPAC